MHIITSIVGYFFGFIILMLILLLVLIQSLLGNQKLFDPAIKFLCRLFPLVFGIKVKAIGFENIDSGKPHIFIANHVNIFDGFILYGYIPNFVRGVELESHFSWPVWGTITRKLGNIPISHTSPKSALKSLDKAGTVITQGTSIAILPEGHRTRNGELQTFMRGPFRLAKKTKVNIIPIVMKGLWDRKSVHSKFVHPGKVEVLAGIPIRAESYEELSDKKLQVLLRNTLLEMLKK